MLLIIGLQFTAVRTRLLEYIHQHIEYSNLASALVLYVEIQKYRHLSKPT